MATIQVQCNSHVLTVVNTPVLAAGSVGVDKIQFEFDSEWSSCGKEAVFWKRSTPDALYRAAIGVDNTCVIPSTVLNEKGVFLFVVRGTSGDDVITTTAITYDVENGIVGEGIDPPAAPEQSVYDQILETVNTFSQKFDEQTGVYNNVMANLNTTVANKVAVYRGKIDAIEANAVHDHYSCEMELLEGSDSSFNVASVDHVTATTVMAASVPAGMYKVTCCLQDIQYADYVHSFDWSLCYPDNKNDHVIEERDFSVRSAGTNITIETLLNLDAAQNIYIRYHELTATGATIQFDVPFTLTFEQMNETKDPEVVDMRTGVDNTQYETAGERIDAIENRIKPIVLSVENPPDMKTMDDGVYYTTGTGNVTTFATTRAVQPNSLLFKITNEQMMTKVVIGFDTQGNMFHDSDKGMNTFATGDKIDGITSTILQTVRAMIQSVQNDINAVRGMINQLPFATDTDGTLYNNGLGYLENNRLTTTGDIAQQSGIYLTGFIPVEQNQVVKFNGFGVVANSSASHSQLCFIAAYDSEKTLIKSAFAYHWANQANNTAVLKDNYLTSIKVTDSPTDEDMSKVAFVRVCGDTISAMPQIYVGDE